MAPGQRFDGDNRSQASTSLKASARTYGLVMFNQFEIVNQFGGSSGTRINLTVFSPTMPIPLGDVVASAKVSITAVREMEFGPDLIVFEAATSGSNPLVPHSPDVYTSVSARFDFGNVGRLFVRCDVRGDNYPNLEVFLLCYRSGNTALLVDGRTTGGRDFGPLMRLVGSNIQQSLGSFSANLALNKKGELAANSTAGATTLPDYSGPNKLKFEGLKIRH